MAATDEQQPTTRRVRRRRGATPPSPVRRARERAAQRIADGPLGRGELISGACGLVLLVFLFATAWYGVAGVPDPSAARPAESGVETGWQGLSDVRWMILLTGLVAIGTVALHVMQGRRGRRTETGAVVLGLGLVTTLLLLYRVLIALPSPDEVLDQKFGAFVGLVCALGIALGGHESLMELRERRRAARPRRPEQPTRSERSRPSASGNGT